MKILISTSSFGQEDPAPLEYCRNGNDVVLNPFGRKLTSDEVLKLASDVEGIIAGTEILNRNVLQKLPNLKVISRCGTGMENVDLEAARELGIKVYNTPDAPTLAVAELAVGLMLNLLRGISRMDRDIKDGKWKKQMGSLLQKKNVGIVGFGRIGKKVARLLMVFEPNLAYYDIAVQKRDLSCALKPLKELLSWADIITLHCSTADGKPIIGKKEFQQMKKGSMLINLSRGSVVDEEALYEALKSGWLGGVALDVFNTEPYFGKLRELDNVILTSHIGSYAKETRIEMEMQAVKNLLLGLG